MRTRVEFRTSKFPSIQEGGELNPGRWGKRLAEYLAVELPKAGIPVARISEEDWGWAVMMEDPRYKRWIGCGNYEEYEDGFLCFIEPHKGYARKFLFRKIDVRDDIEAIASALDGILRADDQIRSIRWWDEEEK